MRNNFIAAICVASMPCVAAAQSGGAPATELLLSCMTTGGKALNLHYVADKTSYFHYRFGPPDSIELELAIPATDVTAYAPWHGVGRSITNGVTLENAGYAYTVWTNFDRLEGKASPITAGVHVTKDEEDIVSFTCGDTPEPAIASPFGIEDAMAAAGLHYDEDQERWVTY